MPVAAKQYDPELDVQTSPVVATHTRRRQAARATAEAPWNQWESLVEHFGTEGAAAPAPAPVRTRKRRSAASATPTVRLKPRPTSHHRPFHLAPMALVMWGTIASSLVALLVIHGATLSQSRKEMAVVKEIKITREAIDNTNKSIAAIQISPEMAHWATANGWRVAEQADFDEVPTFTSGEAR